MNERINQKAFKKFFIEDLGSEIEFCQQLLEIFKRYNGELCALVFENSSKRIEEIRLSAHKLKSSCASFGAFELEDHLNSLENAAKSDDKKEVERLQNLTSEISNSTISEIEQTVAKFQESEETAV